ncbi:PQQ-dependent sugar dehydrogenase [Kutzneria sp. CA-103260]|uniref:PQQ-dependent sugar dehydrogenase n=1 Tax=Kutzneria sp. CA-103260 TaxID=2802641 RepID=UPI001BEE5F81|nr:gluconolaconase [Kutzneria sp. CA-103260]QUQ64660.1 L-sorbosone dehydrogenase [Kutzneria sp. CA-103260]
MTIRRVAALSMAALLAASACSSGSSGPAPAAAAPADLVSVSVTVPAGLDASPLNEPRHVLIPRGWTMSVFARVKAARLEAWTPDGALLVSVPADGTVVRLVPDSHGTATQSVLLQGLNQPHGLTFVGSTLYVAQSDRVDAYSYAAGKATDPKPILTGLPDAKSPELGGTYAHALKSVAVGPDGSVYVSVGSTGNISADDLKATPPRASILRVPPGGGKAEPFAVGVRNGTGLAIAPDGAVWTAVNNRDNIEYPFDRPYGDASGSSQGEVIPEYVRDHPVEPLAKLTAGRNLGWPYCNPDPDTTPGAKGSKQDLSNVPFTRDVQLNPDGKMLDCGTLPKIEQTLGGHSAPLGLSFVNGGLPGSYAQGALVGVHGSWNASPPRAPEVSFFPWANGELGKQQTLVGGFQATDGSRWGRPVAAVLGPDHAVYITDDQAGAIYRLTPP